MKLIPYVANRGQLNGDNMYNVVWEYTAYGESDLPLSVLLDGLKECWKFDTIQPWQRKPSRVNVMKEKLSAILDDENLVEALQAVTHVTVMPLVILMTQWRDQSWLLQLYGPMQHCMR